MTIVFRAIVMFISLFIIVKIIGKKQIKNLTLYDYIVNITIGSIAADSIISLDVPLYDGLIALGIFGLISYVSSFLSYHNHNIEEIMDGQAITLFENGNFNYQNLEMTKLSVAKVLEYCRLKGCFDINELCLAILEPSGDISILLEDKYQALTSNDLKSDYLKKRVKKSFNYLVIVDGALNIEELLKAKKSQKWLDKYLTKQNMTITDIGLLVIDLNDKVTIFRK